VQKEYIWNLFCQTGNIDFYILYKNYDNIDDMDYEKCNNKGEVKNLALR